jgi:hypothetical protein
VLLNEVFKLPLHQSEVDFLIPNLNEDLNLYVDPYLFYKSPNPSLQEVHSVFHNFFSTAIDLINAGRKEKAREILSFPEVKETMLGLSTGNHKGRGMGDSRGDIIFKELVSNDDLLEHGIKHLAEMQLLIEGVGYDMISDMCTNIAKPFLISYTQTQCNLHNIPLEKGICLEHVFDWDELEWDDIHTDLPINPINGHPILLVPKTVVRKFTDIDYKDFWDSTYRYILREIEIQKSFAAIGKKPKVTWKEINEKYNFCKKTVVDVLHEEPDLKRKYLEIKEKEPAKAVDLNLVEGTDKEKNTVEELIQELEAIKPGTKDAKKYESFIARVITLLFDPYLIYPRLQVKSFDGREIIDITFYNAADRGFWSDIKQRHGNTSIPFEVKNMLDISNTEVFQIAARLNENLGMFGILVVRDYDKLDINRAYRRLDKEKKVILLLNDQDIIKMLKDYENGLNPNKYITQKYRIFMEEA